MRVALAIAIILTVATATPATANPPIGVQYLLRLPPEAFAPQPVWDKDRPCGVHTTICRIALRSAGLDPAGYTRATGWRLTMLQAFGWVQWCESRHSVAAVGDNGHALGLWQISDLYWPDERALAFDPWASTFWTAEMWAANLAPLWACWRVLLIRAPDLLR